MIGAVMLMLNKSWLVLACAALRTEAASRKTETNGDFGIMAPFDCLPHYRAKRTAIGLFFPQSRPRDPRLRDIPMILRKYKGSLTRFAGFGFQNRLTSTSPRS